MIRVRLNHQLAGDHGTHPPGSVVELPTEVARQVVEGRHGVALDELPDALRRRPGGHPPTDPPAEAAMIQFNGQVRNLAVATPPAEEPVTLATAKLHLRVEVADDDALIGALIVAARERCEALTHRAFVSRGYLLTLDGFPFSHAPTISMAYSSERLPNLAFGRIKIPKPPLIAVQSIAYLDAQGVSRVLDPSAYLVSAGGKLQGVVTPAYGTTWPATRYQVGSVAIAYSAGYGAATDVPASIAQAILLLVGAWYQNREEFAAPTSSLPMGVRFLLASHGWGSYG